MSVHYHYTTTWHRSSFLLCYFGVYHYFQRRIHPISAGQLAISFLVSQTGVSPVAQRDALANEDTHRQPDNRGPALVCHVLLCGLFSIDPSLPLFTSFTCRHALTLLGIQLSTFRFILVSDRSVL